MSRMFDRILLASEIKAEFREQISRAIVINGDDCALYFWEHAKDKVMVDQALMNLAPPFECPFWIEYRDHAFITGAKDHCWGFLFSSELMPQTGELGQPKWDIQCLAFRERVKSEFQGPIASVMISVMPDGSPYRDAEIMAAPKSIESLMVHKAKALDEAVRDRKTVQDQNWSSLTARRKAEYEAMVEGPEKTEGLRLVKEAEDTSFKLDELLVKIDGLQRYQAEACSVVHVLPAYFTISLLHCKNVELRALDPIPALSKKHERKRGRPLVRWHELNIEPMKTVLRTEGRIGENGIAKALHICRGHFKDFRQRGLFGRNKGVYWWPQQMRGTAESGTVSKDYRVQSAPDEPGSGEAK